MSTVLNADACKAITSGLTPEVLKALDDEHGDVLEISCGLGDKTFPVVMRPLTEREFDAFRFAVDRGGPAKALAAKELFSKSCVYPDEAMRKAAVARYAGLPEGVTSDPKWKRFVGLEVEARGKE